MRGRILIADKLDLRSFEALQARGVDMIFEPGLKADDLPGAISDVSVLVVRSTKVTRATIEAGRKLALVVRAGSGTNTIDVEAASQNGVYVANCPGKNSVAVAELTMGLLLALDRRIADNVADLRASKWNKAGYSKAAGLKGKRLGLVGFGAIAQAVARRALAFDLEVSAFSRTLTDEVAAEHGVLRVSSLPALFRANDIVSLHVPLSEATRGLITRELLDQMPEGAILLNTARAEIVDNEALERSVRDGRLKLGTDVFADEPEAKQGEFEVALGKVPNVYGTHHIGASTEQAQSAIAKATADIVAAFIERGEVSSAVNVLHAPPVQGTLVVRHRDKVGVLASVLASLKRADINVETMENVVFAGGTAACAKIEVSERPDASVLEELGAEEDILGVDLL